MHCRIKNSRRFYLCVSDPYANKTIKENGVSKYEMIKPIALG